MDQSPENRGGESAAQASAESTAETEIKDAPSSDNSPESRMDEVASADTVEKRGYETYEIRLPQFEGPFDLLLFFIERDELDIYDIPIARITNEFLGYMQKMKALNIYLASEFILVASTLMRIKAKMLLPRKELDEEGNEIDPRRDLVKALLEYKRYKEILGQLKELESVRLEQHHRGANNKEIRMISEAFATETDLSNLNLYKLMKTFQRVLDRLNDRKERLAHQVTPYPYTTDACKVDVLVKIRSAKQTPFEDLFTLAKDRVHAVFIFLALLDLVQSQRAKLRIGEGYNNFWVDAQEKEAA